MKRGIFTSKFIKISIAVCALITLCVAFIACDGEEKRRENF